MCTRRGINAGRGAGRAEWGPRPATPSAERGSAPAHWGEMDFRDLRNKLNPKWARPGCADAAAPRSGPRSGSGKGREAEPGRRGRERGAGREGASRGRPRAGGGGRGLRAETRAERAGPRGWLRPEPPCERPRRPPAPRAGPTQEAGAPAGTHPERTASRCGARPPSRRLGEVGTTALPPPPHASHWRHRGRRPPN